MQLADVAAIATVVALLILAYVHAKPAINRWATVKFLRLYSEMHWADLLAREQARALPRRRRLRRWRQNRGFCLTHHLMTRAHRIAQHDLLEQLRVAYDRPEHSPVPPDCDPLVIEAAAVAKHDWNRRQARHRGRVHKKTVCAGGCGTKYGKRRRDHNFFGDSGIEGGWFCPTDISCLHKPTGEHYCGKCELEGRLSTIRQHPDHTSHRTVPSADERASEQQSHWSAPKTADERPARQPTEDVDGKPVSMPAQNTPENRRG
ncbi:MAG: hypothetical protein OXG55_13870 [bacterium]|nr:hypothetical protein [bacterium]